MADAHSTRLTAKGRAGIVAANQRRTTLRSERFTDKIDRQSGGCWLWKGKIGKNGYGYLAVGHLKSVYAHRVSYEMYRGEIPDGLLVCHTCDVRHCVNPDHLFLGTDLDNNRDMRRKGRGRSNPPRGSLSPCAKVNEEQVRLLRSLYAGPQPRRKNTIAGKYNQPELAKLFHLSQPQVATILSGRAWKHIL